MYDQHDEQERVRTELLKRTVRQTYDKNMISDLNALFNEIKKMPDFIENENGKNINTVKLFCFLTSLTDYIEPADPGDPPLPENISNFFISKADEFFDMMHNAVNQQKQYNAEYNKNKLVNNNNNNNKEIFLRGTEGTIENACLNAAFNMADKYLNIPLFSSFHNSTAEQNLTIADTDKTFTIMFNNFLDTPKTDKPYVKHSTIEEIEKANKTYGLSNILDSSNRTSNLITSAHLDFDKGLNLSPDNKKTDVQWLKDYQGQFKAESKKMFEAFRNEMNTPVANLDEIALSIYGDRMSGFIDGFSGSRGNISFLEKGVQNTFDALSVNLTYRKIEKDIKSFETLAKGLDTGRWRFFSRSSQESKNLKTALTELKTFLKNEYYPDFKSTDIVTQMKAPSEKNLKKLKDLYANVNSLAKKYVEASKKKYTAKNTNQWARIVAAEGIMNLTDPTHEDGTLKFMEEVKGENFYSKEAYQKTREKAVQLDDVYGPLLNVMQDHKTVTLAPKQLQALQTELTDIVTKMNAENDKTKKEALKDKEDDVIHSIESVSLASQTAAKNIPEYDKYIDGFKAHIQNNINIMNEDLKAESNHNEKEKKTITVLSFAEYVAREKELEAKNTKNNEKKDSLNNTEKKGAGIVNDTVKKEAAKITGKNVPVTIKKTGAKINGKKGPKNIKNVVPKVEQKTVPKNTVNKINLDQLNNQINPQNKQNNTQNKQNTQKSSIKNRAKMFESKQIQTKNM
ncbi:MAG: hypothetical protein K6F99_04805 [Lachnospiraceae bacterium]|nr:hypothetical protein [Lachnospiraceae bacterium]